jgi:hypothetical protein
MASECYFNMIIQISLVSPLNVFENRVLRRKFGLMKDEVARE